MSLLRYTKQGNLKYHTDCAPNNGYFFIPIYDKGEYLIKVSSHFPDKNVHLLNLIIIFSRLFHLMAGTLSHHHFQ